MRQRKRQLELLFMEHQQSIYIINGEELESVDYFKYLGRPISATGSDWPAVQYNINKARKRWAMISRILTWQGSSPKVMGYYYKAVCQAVLLYGCETWVITQAICNKLESFHHRVARQISKLRIHPDPNTGEWIYPPIDTALARAGLLPIQEYINRRRNYLLPWARERPLLQQSQLLGSGFGGPRRLYWWSYVTNEDEV